MKNIWGKRIVLDFEKMHQNINTVQASIGEQTGIIAVIKGNAYGHGIRQIAEELQNNKKILMYAVSSIQEAINVHEYGKQCLILYPVFIGELVELYHMSDHQDEFRKMVEQQMIFTITNKSEVEEYARIAKQMKLTLSVHMKLDFNGGIRGFAEEDADRYLKRILSMKELKLCGMYAHLYSTYTDFSMARGDLEEYAKYISGLSEPVRKQLLIHLLTSVSFYEYPEYIFDAVRVGAAIYGMPISIDDNINKQYQSIMSIEARLVNIFSVGENTCSDYSGNLLHDVSRIGLVSIGEWDIPHLFRGTGCSVRINGQLTWVAGTPCMDSCCIDLSHITDPKIGDIVYFLQEEEGINLLCKVRQNRYTIEDCQMMFAGMERVPIEIRREKRDEEK